MPFSLERLDDFALDRNGSAELGAFGIDLQGILIDDNLQAGKARAVGKFQKGDGGGIAEGAYPAADGHFLPQQFGAFQYVINIGVFHTILLLTFAAISIGARKHDGVRRLLPAGNAGLCGIFLRIDARGRLSKFFDFIFALAAAAPAGAHKVAAVDAV